MMDRLWGRKFGVSGARGWPFTIIFNLLFFCDPALFPDLALNKGKHK